VLVSHQREVLVEVYRAWGETYRTSLAELEHRREEASARLATQLRKLGYSGKLSG
jgi:type I restriction enzyme M protein